MSFNVQLKILHPVAQKHYEASAFSPATAKSAAFDLVACLEEPVTVYKGGKSVLIPTGIAVFTDREDVAGLILPRSGLGHKKGLVLGNLVGVIDGDYQNQWFVSAWNRGPEEYLTIEPGDHIAQAMFVPVLHPVFDVVEEFSDTTERGLGGFGSTTLK